MSGVEGQCTDKEQQRQDGLIAPDVEGPPTVEETDTQVSNWTGPHRNLHMRVEWTPHSVDSNQELSSTELMTKTNIKTH